MITLGAVVDPCGRRIAAGAFPFQMNIFRAYAYLQPAIDDGSDEQVGSGGLRAVPY